MGEPGGVLHGSRGYRLCRGARVLERPPPREVRFLESTMKSARDWRRDFFALLVAL